MNTSRKANHLRDTVKNQSIRYESNCHKESKNKTVKTQMKITDNGDDSTSKNQHFGLDGQTFITATWLVNINLPTMEGIGYLGTAEQLE